MDANGYRWAGLLSALVMDRVIGEGKPWLPLHMVANKLRGRTLYCHFHVPVPPLRWGTVYRNGKAVDFRNKGFRITDCLGAISPINVRLVGPTTVAMTL